MTETTRISTGMLVLRIGLAFVFLYFGFSQLHNPGQWTGYLPSIVSALPVTPIQMVLMNGLFEILAAALLILGAYTRFTAIVLMLHLFGIAFTLGMNPIGVRDIGISVATLVLAIIGAGTYSLDYAVRTAAAQTPGAVVQ